MDQVDFSPDKFFLLYQLQILLVENKTVSKYKNVASFLGGPKIIWENKFGFKKNLGPQKNLIERNRILNDAKLLESVGVFSIVLECIETKLAKEITNTIKIPTIGIGASEYCDGQILVLDDLLGLNLINARFVKKYCNLKKVINKAVSNFTKDVKKKKFPKKKHSY